MAAGEHVRAVNLYPLFVHRLNPLVDGVHPDDQGYALIAQACRGALK
jgi:hypothetical protein